MSIYDAQRIGSPHMAQSLRAASEADREAFGVAQSSDGTSDLLDVARSTNAELVMIPASTAGELRQELLEELMSVVPTAVVDEKGTMVASHASASAARVR